MSDHNKEIWTSIAVGDDYIGAFLNRGEFGVEAYDADDVLLGVFADEDDADIAIHICWDIKLRSNDGRSDTSSEHLDGPPTPIEDFPFDRLSGEQKDAALDHMLECIAASNSKLLDLQNSGNLIAEIVHSGAPHAAEIFARHAQKINGTDLVPALRKCFAQRANGPPVTVGPLIRAAHECGANLEPFWRLVLDAPVSLKDDTPETLESKPDGDGATSSLPREAPSDTQHICTHCKLDPPDGTEHMIADDTWVHSRCEDAYINARWAEEGLAQKDAPLPLLSKDDSQAFTDILALRLKLLENGLDPVIVSGKVPVMNGWPLLPLTAESLREWTYQYPSAINTGTRAKNTPALDIDIMHQEAAEAVEALARQHFAGRGAIHVRIGLPPKRLIPLRTDAPFRKLTRAFVTPVGADGKPPKIEILGDGQQYVVAGIHPDTRKPYCWTNGAGDMDVRDIKRDDLPLVTAEDCEAFLADAVKLLVEQFGFVEKMAHARTSRHL
jgi:hypothetical protein